MSNFWFAISNRVYFLKVHCSITQQDVHVRKIQRVLWTTMERWCKGKSCSIKVAEQLWASHGLTFTPSVETNFQFFMFFSIQYCRGRQCWLALYRESNADLMVKSLGNRFASECIAWSPWMSLGLGELPGSVRSGEWVFVAIRVYSWLISIFLEIRV